MQKKSLSRGDAFFDNLCKSLLSCGYEFQSFRCSGSQSLSVFTHPGNGNTAEVSLCPAIKFVSLSVNGKMKDCFSW